MVLATVDRVLGTGARSIWSLYSDWWSGIAPMLDGTNPSPETAYHPAESWNVLSRNGGGNLTLARNGEVTAVSPGEWLAIDSGRVLVRRRRRWQQDGFLWVKSRRCPPLTARRWRVRVYVPGGRFTAVREFGRLVRALDLAGYWFEGKVRLGSSRHRDQCVFWLAAGDVMSASGHLLSELHDDPGRLDPPPLTMGLGAVGIAHDPRGSQSLGLAICGAVVAMHDQDASLDLRTRWSLASEEYGLCPEYPWRHPGSVDPFTVWSRLERSRC